MPLLQLWKECKLAFREIPLEGRFSSVSKSHHVPPCKDCQGHRLVLGYEQFTPNPASTITAVMWQATGGAMKDTTVDTVPAQRTLEQENFANRKLIRPSLNRNNDHSHGHAAATGERRERPERSERGDRGGDRNRGGGDRKVAPPEQTNAENFYYQKQMQSKTPMVIVLCDDEEIRGVIEWYDKNCIKVNREGAPNLMIYKPSIKYLYKEGENSGK